MGAFKGRGLSSGVVGEDEDKSLEVGVQAVGVGVEVVVGGRATQLGDELGAGEGEALVKVTAR